MALMMACAAASAQFFSTTEGQELIYKSADLAEKTETAVKSTVLTVSTGEDGVISSRVEDLMSDPSNPLLEVKNYRNYSYNPETDITKVVVMSAEDFKDFVMSMIRQSADAAGQHLSEMDLNDLKKNISSKGNLEFEIDPKMAVDTKLPKSTLRLSAGAMTMRANLWEGKMLGTETVTGPAGTFDCVKLSYTLVITGPNGNDKRNITEWYAKGVGLVKTVDSDKKGNPVSEDVLLSIK